MTRNTALALVFAWLTLPGAAHAVDLIRPSNHETNDTGVLVDGLRNGVHVNDARFAGLGLNGFFAALFPVIPIDDFSASPESNEILAFTRNRPPVLRENVAWTPAGNTLSIEFEDEYAIPVRVWIVDGPFESQRDLAIESGLITSMIWEQERLGVRFSEFEIVDATTDVDAPDFQEFSCSDAIDMKARIGFLPDRLNIYYVGTVDTPNGFPSPNNGVWCATWLIAMGRATQTHVLTHEIGHAFALAHVDQFDEHFDVNNVMHSSSGSRMHLTEGQTFRAVFRLASSLNALYDLRPGGVTRICPHSTDTDDNACPPLQKRIWSESCCPLPGCCNDSWPPN